MHASYLANGLQDWGIVGLQQVGAMAGRPLMVATAELLIILGLGPFATSMLLAGSPLAVCSCERILLSPLHPVQRPIAPAYG